MPHSWIQRHIPFHSCRHSYTMVMGPGRNLARKNPAVLTWYILLLMSVTLRDLRIESVPSGVYTFLTLVFPLPSALATGCLETPAIPTPAWIAQVTSPRSMCRIILSLTTHRLRLKMWVLSSAGPLGMICPNALCCDFRSWKLWMFMLQQFH